MQTHNKKEKERKRFQVMWNLTKWTIKPLKFVHLPFYLFVLPSVFIMAHLIRGVIWPHYLSCIECIPHHALLQPLLLPSKLLFSTISEITIDLIQGRQFLPWPVQLVFCLPFSALAISILSYSLYLFQVLYSSHFSSHLEVGSIDWLSYTLIDSWPNP